MSFVTEPFAEVQNTLLTRLPETGRAAHAQPVVICGMCGAQEKLRDDNSTECPHCDDYIY